MEHIDRVIKIPEFESEATRVEKYYDSDAASLTLGCIILTGYLGGAVAAYTRMGGPYPILVPLSTAMIAWFGIWLRDERLRRLLPVCSSVTVLPVITASWSR